MKKIALFALMSLFLVGLAVAPAGGNPGSIWTTTNSCGDPQNVNHYMIGDTVYINGAGFGASTEYPWLVEGISGCDAKATVMSGNHITNSDGTFCFAAYIVQNDDCGEYRADFNGKKDQYRIDGTIPEFGVLAGAVALVGALGIFLYRRKD